MIQRLNKLSSYQKQVLSAQVAQYEEVQPQIEWNGEYHVLQVGEIDYRGYKCECGNLIADYDDHSGRDWEVDACKCGKHYYE